MSRPVVLQLTWAGFDAAVDVLAALCPRGVDVVCGMDRGGMVLAWALSERLAIECSLEPVNGALLVYGVTLAVPQVAARCADAVVWTWVDATPERRVQSVCKATAGTRVLMPWQDAMTSPRPFVPGFDD